MSMMMLSEICAVEYRWVIECDCCYDTDYEDDDIGAVECRWVMSMRMIHLYIRTHGI